MSKQILLEWDKPASLAELEREQRKDEPRQSGLRILAISLILHGLAIWAVWVYGEENRTGLLFILIVSILFWPIYYYVNMVCICLKTERHYEIREDGILYPDYRNKILYRWRRIQNYNIEPNPLLPQLRVLKIVSGLKWSPVRFEIDFDPAQIPEEKIRALLDAKIKF